MAKNIEIRKDVYDLFSQLDRTTHTYIEELLETWGYADNKEALARTRRNIFKEPIEKGFIENTKEQYIATKKFLELRPLLIEILKSPDCDINQVITTLSQDKTMGFVTTHSLHQAPQIDEQKAIRLLELYIEYMEMCVEQTDTSPTM